MAERGRVGFAPADGAGSGGGIATATPPVEGAEPLDDQIAAGLLPTRDKRDRKSVV